MSEQWRDVVGYEGCYRVSDSGRVVSVPRRRRNKHGWATLPERELRGTPVGRGSRKYLFVSLYTPPHRTPRAVGVHRLVLEAFVGPCPPGMECRHLNDDPRDNRLENLAWGTKQQNYADRVRLGNGNDVTCERGERRYNAKLTEQAVRDIRAARRQGVPLKVLSQRHRVNEACVSAVATGRSWKHVK